MITHLVTGRVQAKDEALSVAVDPQKLRHDVMHTETAAKHLQPHEGS